MAFPTIPTVAAGRVLFTNQADTSQTRTFPSLSSLTKNSGDLLIAIITTYQSSTNPQFSSWGGGFTELSAGGDQGSGTTLGIGIAYKVSDGTETGTFSVTQATTVTGHASMCLLSIPGAHTATAPEAGTKADGTSAAADPGSFNPAGWDVEDTLWIAVAASGMTSGTGNWTATGTAAPTNYTDRADSNTADNSTVGQTEIAVAFRQLAAASEDIGTAGVDTSNARNSALVIAVRPITVVSSSFTVNAVIKKTIIAGSYQNTILTDTPAGYWRLGESEGPTAEDEIGAHDGTYSGSLTYGATALITSNNTSVDFDRASSSQVSISGNEWWTGDSMSLEAWAEFVDPPGNYSGVIGIRGGNKDFYILQLTGGTNIEARWRSTVTNFDLNYNPGAGTHHLVFVKDGTDLTLYVDGVSRATRSDATGSMVTGNGATTIGNLAGFYFNNRLDEAAVYSYALTSTQVAAHYAARNAFSPASLTADAVIKAPQEFSFDVFRRSNQQAFAYVIRKAIFDGTRWVFVAFGASTTVAYTAGAFPGGALTANPSVPDGANAWIAYNGTHYIVVGKAGDSSGAIYTATDPTGTWTRNATQPANTQFWTVEYGNGIWVAVGEDGIYTATDPTSTWTKNTNSTPFGANVVSGVAYANGIWVAAGKYLDTGIKIGAIATATDPTGAWTEAASYDQSSMDAAISNFTTVAYARGYWIISGYQDDTNNIWVATDPTGTWTVVATAMHTTDSGGGIMTGNRGVAISPTRWGLSGGRDDGTIGVRGGIQGTTASSPTSGWALIADPRQQVENDGYNLVGLTYAAGYWVAVGDASPQGAVGAGRLFWAFEPTLDAVIRRTQAGSFTVDAVISGGSTLVEGSFTADAVIKKAQTSALTSDAVVKREQLGLPAWRDYFDDAYLDPSKWIPLDANVVTESGGVISAPANGYYEIDSTKALDMTGATAEIEIGTIAHANSAVGVGLEKTVGVSFGPDIKVFGNGDIVATSDGSNLNANAAGVSRVRIVEKSGSYHFAYYANGAWTEIGSLAAPAGEPASALYVYTYLDRFSGTTSIESIFAGPPGLFTDAVIRRTQTGSLTADAVIVAETGTVNGSFTADAVIKKAQTSSLTSDAVINREAVGSLTADAVIRRVQAGAVTTDAVLFRAISASFSAAAVLTSTQAGTLTASAVIRTTTTGNATASAVVTRTQSGTPTADAVLRSTPAGSFSANAIIAIGRSGSLTADAKILRVAQGSLVADAVVFRAGIAGTFAADALARVPRAGTATADAVVVRTLAGAATLDAVIFRTIAGALTGNAFVAGQLRADAVVGRASAGSIAADAFIPGRLTANAVVRSTSIASLTADAFVQGAGVGALSADATLKATVADSLTANATALRSSSGSATADALIERQVSGAFVANAVIRATIAGPLTANSVVGRTSSGSATGDAVLFSTVAGARASDAVFLRSSSGSFTATAVKHEAQTGSATADAFVQGAGASSFTANAVVRRSSSASFTANANVEIVGAGSLTANAVIRATIAGSLTANAVAFATPSATLAANAVTRATASGDISADALKRKIEQASAATDAVVLATRTAGASADAVFLTPRSSSFTGAAVVLASPASSVTADAVVIPTGYTFTADAIIFSPFGGELTLDAMIRRVRTRHFRSTLEQPASISGRLEIASISGHLEIGSFGGAIGWPVTVRSGSFTAGAQVE